MRIAGEEQYELQVGEDFTGSGFQKRFNNLVAVALSGRDPNKKVKLRLMFEVEQ